MQGYLIGSTVRVADIASFAMIGFKKSADPNEELETPEKILGKKRFVKPQGSGKTNAAPKVMDQAATIQDDLEHVEACQRSQTCPRCYFLRNKEALESATPVKYFNSSSWLEARLVDGVWGVGCLVCSAAGLQTDFANFSVRSYLHMGNCKRHGASLQHQKALNLLNLDNAKIDQKLAPNLSEWQLILDHRRGVASLSFSLSVEQLGKRFKITKMQWCLAEAARDMVRSFLRQAGSIALSQDARKNKLLAACLVRKYGWLTYVDMCICIYKGVCKYALTANIFFVQQVDKDGRGTLVGLL